MAPRITVGTRPGEAGEPAKIYLGWELSAQEKTWPPCPSWISFPEAYRPIPHCITPAG
ncbi:hypothetical protein B0A49_13829, partial [Cryomyces minteri]